MNIYTTIHINEAISLVLVRALLEYRSRMTSHNKETFFSEQFRAILMYKTNRFHFAVRMYCNRSRKMPKCEKNKKSRHSTSSRAVLFSSFHAMTSTVIYYSTHARQNEIYLLILTLIKNTDNDIHIQ